MKIIDLTQNSSGGGGSDATKIEGGTVVEGLFSDLPTFIAGLSGKFSNGTVTYKISQDETIDATVLPDTYGSLAVPVPLWNIPEVVIDGNEKTITITSSNPYVPCVAFAPADFDMGTGTLITNYNSKYQVLKIKDLTVIGTPQNTDSSVLFNSADINLKIENCSITNTIEGSVIDCQDGLNEIYTTTITSQGSTVANNIGISSINMGSVKCYNNTYNNIGTEVYTKTGGRVQANNELYDGIIFEGKFSDLPTFFASLDGKSLNGTVIYKITEDETCTIPMDITIPNHNISNIVIEGNEKTITGNLSTDWQILLKFNNNSTVQTYLNIQNLNIVKGSTTAKFTAISNFCHTIFLNLKSCSINSVEIGCSNKYGVVQNCEFSNITGFGVTSSNCGILKVNSNIFTSCHYAIAVERGGLAIISANTFTNNTNNYYNGNQTFNNGLLYQS